MSWFHLPSCSERRRAFGKKCLKRLGLALLVICLIILIALEILSRGAAQIFNYAMANQDMLRGTITVERLISDITGHVYFTGLEWKDREGNPILEIPSGDFRVNVWDVLTRDFKSTTIRELTVNQPSVSVHLSDDMKVDFVRPSPDMDQLKKEPEDWREKVNLATLDARERRAVGQWRREHHQQKVQRDWHNFNAAGKHLKLRLNVHDGGVEVFYRERHYVMSHVQMAVDLDTAKQMSLDMSIGGFGGTMIGDAIALNGTVDFTEAPEPACNMALVLYQVDPSSLGFGVWSHVTPLGMDILDFFDFLSNTLLMPIVSFLICFIVAYILKPNFIIEEAKAEGATFRTEKFYRFMIRVVAPIGIVAIWVSSMAASLGLISL